jgi:hypothetical protein
MRHLTGPEWAWLIANMVIWSVALVRIAGVLT